MPIPKSRQLELNRRRQQILEMAIAGATTRQIAQTYTGRGETISHVQVSKDIKTALAELADGNREDADVLRGLFNQRYERMFMRIWTRAIGRPVQRDETGQVVQAEIAPDEDTIDRCIRILAEMRRLNGLDLMPEIGTVENPMHMSIIELAKAYEQNGYSRTEESTGRNPQPRILPQGSIGSEAVQ